MSEKILHDKKLRESTSVLRFCILRSTSAFTAPTTPVFLRSFLLTYELLLCCLAELVEKDWKENCLNSNHLFIPNVHALCIFPANVKYGILIKRYRNKYRVIHKSIRDFRTRLRNNQDRHGRKEHINR